MKTLHTLTEKQKDILSQLTDESLDLTDKKIGELINELEAVESQIKKIQSLTHKDKK